MGGASSPSRPGRSRKARVIPRVDLNCVLLSITAYLSLRMVYEATQSSMEALASSSYPSVEVYFCGPKRSTDMSNSYSAAWVATRGRFMLGVPLGMPFLGKHLTPGLMKRADFRLSDHLEWRTVNMEGASYLMMRRPAKDARGALRTSDAFDFYVEHLSAYERMLGLLDMQPAATHDAVVAHVLARLRPGWEKGANVSPLKALRISRLSGSPLWFHKLIRLGPR